MINKQIDLPMDKIIAFCQRHPIRKLSLFGSVLRDDFGPESDIDVLVELEPEAKISYLDLAGMQVELSDIVGRQVDLGLTRTLRPHLRDHVLRTALTIYERE